MQKWSEAFQYFFAPIYPFIPFNFFPCTNFSTFYETELQSSPDSNAAKLKEGYLLGFISFVVRCAKISSNK